MLSIMLCFLLLAPPYKAEPSAETFATAGEAHLRRAPTAEHPLEEFEGAHKNFDAAYLVAEDARYLCRALAVADLALRKASFADEQERLSWEEIQRDDLERLRDDAIQKQRGNCRFDASGKPPPLRGALLDADTPVVIEADAAVPPAPPNSPSSASKPPRDERRLAGPSRAHTTAGALLTTAGLGLLGGTFGVIGVEFQRAEEMRSLIDTARAERRKFTEAENRRFDDLAADLLRGRDVAIGVGVAGLVSLGTGIAVLATRKRASRGYALLPYGGFQSAGAILRLKF